MTGEATPTAVVLVGTDTTAGRLALLETTEYQGSEPPCHRHHWEDELLYVLEGELRLFLEGQWLLVRSGRAVMVPRQIEHTFAVMTNTVCLLTVYTPGGFEGFYRECGERANQVEQWVTIAARYGCEITGPHPGRPPLE